MNLSIQCSTTTALAVPKVTVCGGRLPRSITLNWKGPDFWILFPHAIYLLFSCHHLSVALLSTSTKHSRISSQTSAGKMLLTHSELLTDSTLKKHTLFFRWVILWTDFHEISCKSPVTALEMHHQQQPTLLMKRCLWAMRRAGTEWVWTFLCLLDEGKR